MVDPTKGSSFSLAAMGDSLAGSRRYQLGFAVKVNSVSRDPKIHRDSCSEVRKRGGVGIHGQVEWRDFEDYATAVAWGTSKGLGTIAECKKCFRRTAIGS